MITALLLVAMVSSFLTACGQKGPLKQPERAATLSASEQSIAAKV